jgi:hypothetical protein
MALSRSQGDSGRETKRAFLYVEVELEEDTTGSGTFTVTYTSTFTEVSPYSALSSPNCGGTASLEVLKDQAADWAMITVHPFSEDVTSGYVAIQLSSLTSTVKEGDLPDSAPALEVLAGGSGTPLASFSLPVQDARVRTFDKFFTRVFAINSSKVDAQGTCVQVPDQSAITSPQLRVANKIS